MDTAKILVIDDEFPVRYLIEHQLRRRGFEVNSAKDGPSGMKAAHIQKPDLIVLDIMMPEMDGFEVCQQIRRNPATSSIPVIFLTACMTRKHKLQAFNVGADDYLVKPFQADELVAHIKAVLRRVNHTNQKKEPQTQSRGRVVALYSPKGGVGTTTLAIQISEAVAQLKNRPVVLIDLDLPLGGIAPLLNFYTQKHVVDLLQYAPESGKMPFIKKFMQSHRLNLHVIPAPDYLIKPEHMPSPANLEPILNMLVTNGYQVILDLGSRLTDLTIAALQQADLAYIITSGQPVANKLFNRFVAEAEALGLKSRRLLPVINELHGPVERVELDRVPLARIPHASEHSRTHLRLKDQGMQKLVSMML